MADLRTLFAEVGAQNVTTYIQSGNVVFASGDGPAELAKAIEQRMESDHGLDVTVLLRTKAQLAKVLGGNPFASGDRDVAKLHVTFLADSPDRARVRELDAEEGGPDEFRLVGREIYLHCPNGYGRTLLNNAFFEKRLGVRATTRNWRTVTKLAELTSA
jgi:uncharacterized protein (DUF1697 family)